MLYSLYKHHVKGFKHKLVYSIRYALYIKYKSKNEISSTKK